MRTTDSLTVTVLDLDAALGGNADLLIGGGFGLYLKQLHLEQAGDRFGLDVSMSDGVAARAVCADAAGCCTLFCTACRRPHPGRAVKMQFDYCPPLLPMYPTGGDP